MTQPIKVHEFGLKGDDAPVLVLVHGVTDSGDDWPDAVTHWQDAYRILAVDHRGHGHSPRFAPEERVDLASRWLADLIGVLEDAVAETGQKPLVVGHSLGANLTLQATLARPDLVQAAVLEDPPLPTAVAHRNQGNFGEALKEWVSRFVGAEARAEQVAQANADTPWTDTEIEAWADSKARVDAEALPHLNLPEFDWAPKLAALTVPTLMLLPTDEPLGGAEVREGELAPVLAATNPLFTVQWISGVGHCMRRDNPASYYEVVDPFLSGHLGD